jgi:hypothetical protein
MKKFNYPDNDNLDDCLFLGTINHYNVYSYENHFEESIGIILQTKESYNTLSFDYINRYLDKYPDLQLILNLFYSELKL